MNHDSQQQQEQAALWAVRITESPLDAAQQAQLQQWLQQNEQHAALLQQAVSLWRGLGQLTPEQQALLFPAPAANETNVQPIKKARRLPSWGIAALLMLGVLTATQSFSPLSLWLQADYRTAEKPQQGIMLPDGSRVDLDSGSAIALQFNDQQRQIKLLRGNAWFTVAPVTAKEKRPFVVVSDAGSTQALGTQFMLLQEDQGTTVAVFEHSVKVTTPSDSLVLQEQQAAQYQGQQLTRLPHWQPSQASAWHRGLLIIDQQPLSVALTQLSRYRAGEIIVANPALRQKTVSGVFALNQLDGALDGISQQLSLRQVKLPGVTFLY